MNVIEKDISLSDADVIVHQVNCQGIMGSGVAFQVRQKFPDVYKQYRNYCCRYENTTDMLGHIQTICVGKDPVRYIVNLFAQDRIGARGEQYTDYDSLRKCLTQVNVRFKGKRIAVPYLMSCCRGGGDWGIVSNMITDTLSDCDVTFYKYTPEVDV